MSDYFTQVRCLECGHEMPPDVMLSSCAACESEWLDAVYDYDAVAKIWKDLSESDQNTDTLWRYQALLPLTGKNPRISMGEGYTPLIRLYPYEDLHKKVQIYVKDERQGPTNSLNDRRAVLAVTAMQHAGLRELVMPSAGDSGVSYAAYCARANIKLWVFFSSEVPSEKMREAALYGAEVVKVSGGYDATRKVAAQFAERRGIHLDRGARFIPGKESMKTLAFEIANQLGLQSGLQQDGHQWRVPDWYIQAVPGHSGPLGVWKGFSELLSMGFIDKMPRFAVVQLEQDAPLVDALLANQDENNLGFADKQMQEVLGCNDSIAMTVSQHETFRAMRSLSRRAGISVEVSVAPAFAGLERMLDDGTISSDETVVVNCAGHTMPVQGSVVGSEYVLDLQLGEQSDPQHVNKAFQASLGLALQSLDERITTILLVDDNASDRRLVRRLLQRYKSYRIFEAENGQEAYQMAQDHLPDLIVADLTMPEMDGFTLIEKLKSRPDTKNIPVVVLSAKALTEEDNKFLTANSKSVWTKGSFVTTELADYVVELLGDTPIEIVRPKPAATRKPDSSVKKKSRQNGTDDKQTILVIDDNLRDIRLARRLLESTGEYRVIDAISGAFGLEKAREENPDLILLDLMMPDMDGITVLKTIQEDESLSTIPIIVVSAKELTAEERNELRDRVRSLVQKSSFDARPFLAKVQQTLSNKSQTPNT